MTLPGTVFLVGAGPGDPDLITRRGLECLRTADVVVYDRLVHPALLKEALHAELIDVGKQPDHHPVPQAEINTILVREAWAGRTVCRLKGGDPFVFGRGGEEAEALDEAGIPFEVVPGVTSAVAVPAYAGIPVTHRDLACSFTVVTGHRKGAADASCDWERAAGADTLVFLMGVTALPEIAEQLIACGRSPSTPAAVIEQGTRPGQRTVTGDLSTIAARVVEVGVRPPAALIVGEVVGLRERLRWFDRPGQRPLRGLRVLNTRPVDEAAEFSRALRRAGAEPVELPTTEILAPADPTALDAAIAALAAGSRRGQPAYDWIGFTSARAVTAVCARTEELGYDSRIFAGAQLAAVGPTTADRLRAFGLRADLTPDYAAGRHLAAALRDSVRGKRILLPRSQLALRDLPEALAVHGAAVIEVVAYETRPAPPDDEALAAVLGREVDAAAFFSPSAVTGLAAQVAPQPLSEVLKGVTVACLGKSTADAAHTHDLAPFVAGEPTIAGVLDCLGAAGGGHPRMNEPWHE